MNRMILTTAVMAPVVLAACGGNPAAPTPPPTYAQMLADTNTLMDAFFDEAPVAGTALPTSGTASYAGFLAANMSDGTSTAAIVGDLNMDVDFSGATGGVTGTVTNLLDSTNAAYAGTLVISDGLPGTLDRTAPGFVTFNATIGGTLTDQAATTYDIAGSLQGGFSGASGPDLIFGTGGQSQPPRAPAL
jgi:hypothetical protein